MINIASALKKKKRKKKRKKLAGFKRATERIKPNGVMNLPIKKPPCTYKYIKGIFAFETNYLLSRDKATKNAKRKKKKLCRRQLA